MWRKKKLRAILVENNPYDRAVIDIVLAAERTIELQYTILEGGKVRAVDLDALEVLLSPDACAPYRDTVVLLDLALTQQCEQAMASTQMTQAMEKGPEPLLSVIQRLSQWGQRAQLVVTGASIDLAGALNYASVSRGWGGHHQGLRLGDTGSHISELVTNVSPPPGQQAWSELMRGLAALRRQVSRTEARELLVEIWGGDANGELASTLSTAPSLWRIIRCVMQHPDKCFFVVSHYADERTRRALSAVLGCRNPVANDYEEDGEGKAKGYADLVINKADLGDLAARIIGGREWWLRSASSHGFLAPFAQFAVRQGPLAPLNLADLFLLHWRLAFLRPKGTLEAAVLWDDTGYVVGSQHAWLPDPGLPRGWGALIQRFGAVSPELRSSLDQSELLNSKDAFVVLPEYLADQERAAELGGRVTDFLRARGPAAVQSFILVGGTQDCRQQFRDHLGVETSFASIQRIGDQTPVALQSLLDDLPVTIDATKKVQPGLPGVPDQQPGSATLKAHFVGRRSLPIPWEGFRDRVVHLLKRSAKGGSGPEPWDSFLRNLDVIVRAAWSSRPALETALEDAELVTHHGLVGGTSGEHPPTE